MAAVTDSPHRRSRAIQVYTVTGAAFAAATAALGGQMLTGHDPALGAGTSASSGTVASGAVALRRRVVIRRIEQTIVVTRVLPPRSPGSAPHASGSVASPSSPARVVSSKPAPAPAPAAVITPAPAAPPSPAPAPAPVTRSS
jgi:hypothetical protein